MVQLGGVPVIEKDGAIVGLMQTDQAFQEDRLPRTRLTNDQVGLSLFELRIDALEHFVCSKGFLDVLYFDHQVPNRI